GWSRGASDRLEWVDSIALGVGDRERQESLHPNFWGQYALRNCLRQAYGNGSPRSGTCLRDPAGGLDEQGEPRMKLDPVPVRTFGKTVFAATANSYAGNIIGDRGSLRQQLDRGVRQIELAIRNDGAGLVVGKNSAGDGVDKTVGNPSSMKLDAWLKVVADWMHTPVNRSAAPVTLVLDARTALSSADDHTLNAMLRGTFQDRLFTKDPAKVPVGDLTGRVIPVLTGDAAARQDYVFTTGTDPAVAANAEGMVIAVNEYPAGALQYWSGRINSDGSVSWIESAKYDTGVTPSVALTDDGRLVEVHRAPTSDVLWYRLGTLGLDGHVSWKPVKDGKLSDKYADGMRPTLKFAGNNAVSEIHQRDKEGHRRSLSGSIGSTSVTWSGGHDTTVAFYPRQDALAFGWEVVVLQSAYHGSPGNTLLYKTRKWGDTAFGAPQRIIGPQVARIECRKDDSASLTAYLQPYCGFFGMAAGTAAAVGKFANDQRAKGVPLRMWYFTGDTRSDPVPTFPATIRPRDTWYRDYIASHNYMW
ncbi:MAG: hypothetical protein HOV67_35025, partial [Kribbellaceae bacterium]|nr:hypothetical protein [Kribbellaceae bacterium]